MKINFTNQLIPRQPRNRFYKDAQLVTYINRGGVTSDVGSGSSISFPFTYDADGIYFETQSLTTDKIEKYDSLTKYLQPIENQGLYISDSTTDVTLSYWMRFYAYESGRRSTILSGDFNILGEAYTTRIYNTDGLYSIATDNILTLGGDVVVKSYGNASGNIKTSGYINSTESYTNNNYTTVGLYALNDENTITLGGNFNIKAYKNGSGSLSVLNTVTIGGESITSDKILKYDVLTEYITTETEDDWQYYSLNGDTVVDGIFAVYDASLFVGTAYFNDLYAFNPSYFSELTVEDKLQVNGTITATNGATITGSEIRINGPLKVRTSGDYKGTLDVTGSISSSSNIYATDSLYAGSSNQTGYVRLYEKNSTDYTRLSKSLLRIAGDVSDFEITGNAKVTDNLTVSNNVTTGYLTSNDTITCYGAINTASLQTNGHSLLNIVTATGECDFKEVVKTGVLNLTYGNLFNVRNYDHMVINFDAGQKALTRICDGQYGAIADFSSSGLTIADDKKIETPYLTCSNTATFESSLNCEDKIWCDNFGDINGTMDFTSSEYIKFNAFGADRFSILEDTTLIVGKCEVDNLYVKNTLYANLYEVKKVRATNGDLLVTDSGTIKTILNVGTQVVLFAVNEDYVMFEVGDVVAILHLDGMNIFRQDYTVTVVNNTGTIQAKHNDSYRFFNPLAGDTVVRISGNLIKLSADEQVIDLKTSDTINTRIGKLEGIEELSGYGLYSDNAYITGDIHARNLTLDNKLTAALIDTDNLTAKKLKTAESGARIVAQGPTLTMVGHDEKTKMVISGEQYKNYEEVMVEGSTKLHKVNTVNNSYTSTGGTKNVYLTLCNNITVPEGTWAVKIPTIDLLGDITCYDYNGIKSKATVTVLVTLEHIESGSYNVVYKNSYTSSYTGLILYEFNIDSEALFCVDSGNYDLNLQITYTDTTSATVEYDITSSALNDVLVICLTNQTHIYSNGFAYKATSNKYFSIVDYDDQPVMQVRQGNYLMKVTETGIYCSRNAGSSWVALFQ